jgi:hypothetical protein
MDLALTTLEGFARRVATQRQAGWMADLENVRREPPKYELVPSARGSDGP